MRKRKSIAQRVIAILAVVLILLPLEARLRVRLSDSTT